MRGEARREASGYVWNQDEVGPATLGDGLQPNPSGRSERNGDCMPLVLQGCRALAMAAEEAPASPAKKLLLEFIPRRGLRTKGAREERIGEWLPR